MPQTLRRWEQTLLPQQAIGLQKKHIMTPPKVSLMLTWQQLQH